MSRYTRYKKDSTIEKKVLRKYNLSEENIKKMVAGGPVTVPKSKSASIRPTIAPMKMASMNIPGSSGISNAAARNIPIGGIDGVAGLASSGIEAVAGDSAFGAASSGVLTGAAAGSALGPIGAVAGGVIGGISGLLTKRSKDKAAEAEEARLLKMMASDANNSPVRTISESAMAQSVNKAFKYGGDLNEYNGLTHAQGGIPLGEDIEVEDKETNYDDFIYSDSIMFDNKKTFADISKKINNKYSLRPKDKFSLESKKMELNTLADQQEALKNEEGEVPSEFKKGGKTNFKYGGKKLYKDGGDFNKIKNSAKVVDSIDGYTDVTANYSNVPAGTVIGMKDGKIVTWKPSNSDIRKQFNKEFGEASNKKESIFTFTLDGKPYTTEKASSKPTKELVYTKGSGLTTNPEIISDEYDIEENMQMETVAKDYSYDTPEINPLTPDYLGIAASTIPGLVSGFGNLNISNKINYDKIPFNQIRLTDLDPTRAVQEIRGQINATGENIRQNARGIGSYLSNRVGLQGTGQRGTSAVFADYDNRNVGIDNQEKHINFNAKERASYTNADIQRREQQDILGFEATAISGFGNAAMGALDYYRGDKQFRDYQQLLRPDYLLAKVNGQTQAVPREWQTNQNQRDQNKQTLSNFSKLSSNPIINDTGIGMEDEMKYEYPFS